MIVKLRTLVEAGSRLGRRRSDIVMTTQFAQQPDYSEGATSAYRAYLIGSHGRITNSIAIDADNDDKAIAKARELAQTHDVELWDRGRMIMRLPKSPPKPH